MNIPDSAWGSIYGGLVGALGTLVVVIFRWLLSRNAQAKKQVLVEEKHQKAIEDANFKLAAELRDEMRKDNAMLRERTSANEARINDLVLDNQKLRSENMELMGKNGALTEKAETQGKQIAILERMVQELQFDRQVLVDALMKANIPMPVELYRKPGTGPLGQKAI